MILWPDEIFSFANVTHLIKRLDIPDWNNNNYYIVKSWIYYNISYFLIAAIIKLDPVRFKEVIYRVFRNLLLGGTEKTVISTVMKFSGIVVSTVADLLGLLLGSFEHFPIFAKFFPTSLKSYFSQIWRQEKFYASSSRLHN